MDRSTSSSPPEPCRCDAPNADCRRAGLPMVGRLWELCAAVRCTPEQSAAYRRLWDGSEITHPSLCMYIGPATGELQSCGSCRGRVRLKVFSCRHPSHAEQPTTTLADCGRCGDYFSPASEEP